MLGIPEADRDEVRGWSDAMLHREAGDADITPEGLEGATRLYGYLHALVEARRAHPTTDMTSALVSASDDARALSANEVTGFLFLLVIAGNETTTKLIGNARYWLWRLPDQRARLVTRDVELHGVTLPAGMKGLLLFGSANRDPRHRERADELDLGRNPAGHVGFGHGIHHCLGAALARLETRVALEELLPRLGGYEIDEAASSRVHSGNVRGFAQLPIRGAAA
jgi:cytochrome P450